MKQDARGELVWWALFFGIIYLLWRFPSLWELAKQFGYNPIVHGW